MLQADLPDTFILATNTKTTVREFARMAFEAAGIDLDFQGEGLDEIGIDRKTRKILVRVNSDFFRPAEVDLLIGDYSKASKILSWSPTMSTEELCRQMVLDDLNRQRILEIQI